MWFSIRFIRGREKRKSKKRVKRYRQRVHYILGGERLKEFEGDYTKSCKYLSYLFYFIFLFEFGYYDFFFPTSDIKAFIFSTQVVFKFYWVGVWF